MLSLEQYKQARDLWREQIAHIAPTSFVVDVAMPWFDGIAPARAKEYGTEFFERFGPTGVMFQLLNCWYRYRKLNVTDASLEMIHDNLIDAFGYTIILAVTCWINPAVIMEWPTAASNTLDLQEHLITNHFIRTDYVINEEDQRLIFQECLLILDSMWQEWEVVSGQETVDHRHA